MSITDSTTTLDTAWTETYETFFTTGVLSDISACVSEVESKLKRGTLSATSTPTLTQVKNWLKRAKLKLASVRDFSFSKKYASAQTTAGYYIYSLPADYKGGDINLRDLTNNYNIERWTTAWYDKKYPDPGEEQNGQPLVYCVKNLQVWLAPPPDTTIALGLDYSISGAETTTDDMGWLPEHERFLCCDFAIGMAFESLHMFDVADRYLGRWYDELNFSVKADGQRKWKIGSLKAIDVFQEAAARNHQS